MPTFEPKIKRHSLEIVSENGGPPPPSKPTTKMDLLPRNRSQKNPNSPEKASGKKPYRKGVIVTKKISPKSDKRRPDLRKLFDKIRKKKEMEAERKRRSSIDTERKIEAECRNEVEKESDGILRGGHFCALPRFGT